MMLRQLFLVICFCLLIVPAFAQTRSNATVDQLLEALGGQTFLDVKDIHTSGRFYGFARGELNSGDLFVDYVKFPDMERAEFGGPKNKSITINRGKAGMKVEGKKEPEEISPGEGEEFLKEFKTSLDYVLRFVIRDRQTTTQNLPSEIINFKRTDVLELRDAAKNRI